MKKLLFGASAVTGLLFASCQQETIPSGQNEGNVSFEVNIPDAIATKGTINDGATIADGTNVNVLHYAIYMTNDGTVNSIDEDGTTPFFQDVVEMTLDQGTRKRSATVNFNLIQDQYYTILFWAQQSAEATGMNAHYELGDLRVISMTTDAVAEGDAYANDESRAAFYAKYEFNTVEKKSHNVTLTRPFSQLNLLTTPESLTISQPGQTTGNYTIDIKQSQVTVTGVATQFDTRAGMAVEESTGTYTFALAQTPEEQGQETLSVGDKNYHYVSMNYFFVPFNEVTDVELDYSIVTTLGAPIKNTVINVPIKKNHRTNLIGNLLTKETTFEIVVDSTFVQPSIDIILPLGDEIVELSDGSVAVATSAAFHEVLANAEDGDVIRVAGPVVLPTSISNANSGRLTIVGLVAEASVSFDSKAGSADGGLNCYADGMDLVFQGIRVVSPNTGAAYSGGFGYANSVTFIDCEYVGQYRAVNATTQFIDCTIDPQTSYIYTDSANADFTGCTFNCSEGKGIQVYSDNSAAATVVNVTECTFNAAKQGATWDGKPVTAIDINSIGGKFTVNITNSTAIGFPEGLVSGESLFNIKGGAEYVTVTVDGSQWVSKDKWINEVGDPVVCSAEVFHEVLAEAAANSTIVLGDDITLTGNYQLQKNVTIDLDSYSMTVPMINIHSVATVENGTINGKVYARKNSDITFDGVKFSGAVADNLSTEGHLAIQSGCNLYVRNCIFSPTSVSGTQTKPISFEGGSSTMKFENCEFKNSPYKKQVYFNSLSATATLNFTNCNFNNKTPNIMFAAACPITNLTMNGTTKLSSVTLELNRAKDAVTADDLAYMKTMIENNSFSSVRVFYAGGASEYIR